MADISASYITKFDDMVKQAYQEMGGKLRGGVHVRTGVNALKHQFNVYGTGFAKDAPTAGADVDTMGSATSSVECNLSDKQASEYSNIFDQDKVNFDDEQELVKVIAAALGRSEDQIIIDALDAPTYTGDHSIAIDFESTGTNTGLTVEKIEEAVVVLDDAGVAAEGRVFVAPAKAKRGLLASARATSSEYVGDVRPLVNGQIDEFLGFKFVWIADTYDSVANSWYGLPGAGTTSRKCFAMHGDALALAVGNLDKQTRIDYVAQKTSYLVLAPLRAGAVVRETAGVVEVNIEL
jgi:hypothetical protein